MASIDRGPCPPSIVALALIWALSSPATAFEIFVRPAPPGLAGAGGAGASSTHPVQLVLDDGVLAASVGVLSQTSARQFLWFNRFTPAEPFLLTEVQVLFPSGGDMAAGLPVELVVYLDPDGDPTTGALLLRAWLETIQAVDGSTFSVYAVSPAVGIPAGTDLLVGVVPRFITSGVTPPIAPAALDGGPSHGRSWLAVWSGDPPQPPALSPPPDDYFGLVDAFAEGNWMIRAFGEPLPASVLEIPTLSGWGGVALVALLMLAATTALAGRRWGG